MVDLLSEPIEDLLAGPHGSSWFFKAYGPDLFKVIEQAPVDDIERISYAANEIERRGNAGAMMRLERLTEQRGLIVYPWLTRAREALSLLEPIPSRDYRSSVYVIARSGYEEQNQTYGVYVGQTSKTPEERCKEHLAWPRHPRAARGLPEHGIGLVYSLMHPWIKVPAQDELRYETSLNAALQLAIPKVTGDIQKDFRDWLPAFQPRLYAALEERPELRIWQEGRLV